MHNKLRSWRLKSQPVTLTSTSLCISSYSHTKLKKLIEAFCFGPRLSRKAGWLGVNQSECGQRNLQAPILISKVMFRGIALEDRSIVTMRLRDPEGKNQRTISTTSKTQITDIQENRPPADTFLPSKEYKELKPGRPGVPANKCDPTGGGLRVDRQD